MPGIGGRIDMEARTARRGRALAGFCALLLVAGSLSAETIYRIDRNHTTIGFAASILGLSKVTGKFPDFEGTIVVPDDGDLAKATVTVRIQAASVDTGIADRDQHLRTPDFFSTEKFPQITFQSKSVRKTADGYAVRGDFALRGVTKEVEIPFQITGRKGKVLGAHASFPLNRRDYGVSWSRVMEDGAQFVADEVTVEISLITRVGLSPEEYKKVMENRRPDAKD
jgi:polyisoprenoid-binding protein YceI